MTLQSKARIIRDGTVTDANGFAKWTNLPGGQVALSAEGDFQGYSLLVFWRKFNETPVPLYINDVTKEQLILTQPGVKTLFALPARSQLTVQVVESSSSGSDSDSDDETPVANTTLTGLYVGV